MTVMVYRMELADRLTAEWYRTLNEGNTAAAYANDLNLWRTWCEANGVNLLTARKSDTGRWIRDQQARGFAKRTIARRVSAVAAWYDFLHEETADSPAVLAAENPARTRNRPKVARDDSPTLGLSKIYARQLILAADADSLRSGALIRFLLGNGLRVGTVVGARIEDLAEDDGHHVIFLRGKGDVRRKVPIPPPGYNAIMKMVADRGHPAEGPLFATSTGRPVDRHYIFRLIRRLAVRAEIPSAERLSPHSLRHSFATEALKRGVPLHQLQDDMWHADSRTTEIYNRARNRLAKSAAYVVAGGFEPVTDDE